MASEKPHDRQPPEPALIPNAKVIDSQSLFEGHREVIIRHEGEIYRLRLTRNGKLILQK
jgi:hemin uptake protein HemP